MAIPIILGVAARLAARAIARGVARRSARRAAAGKIAGTVAAAAPAISMVAPAILPKTRTPTPPGVVIPRAATPAGINETALSAGQFGGAITSVGKDKGKEKEKGTSPTTEITSFSALSSGSTTSPTGSISPSRISSTPTTNVVNAFNMNPLDPMNAELKFDELEAKNYQGLIPATIDTTEKKDGNNFDEIFKKFTEAEDRNKLPSAADAFNRAQRESGILQAQQNVSNLTGTLNQIVAQGQASQLSLVL